MTVEVSDGERAAIRAVRRFLLNDYCNKSWRVSDEYSMLVLADDKEIAELRQEREHLQTVSAVLDRILAA